ncbi:MAG: hydroxymethylbilane synthase [Desulfurococcales archaeon]|nr:hydroxymethylbilane synthase [Desulfurococcales archaeon]
MPRLRVAARGSRLSLEQVRIAMEWVRRSVPGLAYEVIRVTTRGDADRSKPIYLTGIRGAFEREVDQAVLSGDADVAVHSMKDLPSRLPNGLEIVTVPPRGSPYEALVPRGGAPTLNPEHLPPGARVAAGSARRRAMMLAANPSVELTWIRGNLDTRLRRLDEGRADYLVAAEAGLERLGVRRPWRRLAPVPYTPAPGQGLIAVVAPSESSVARLLRGTRHPAAWAEAVAERVFLEGLGGACGRPVGALARLEGAGRVRVLVGVFHPEGRGALWGETRSRDPAEAGEAAASLARSLEASLASLI